ncbi:MAG: hypothetical protein ACFFFT_00040 [Candidatus Thorarchaeota archaeon]
MSEEFIKFIEEIGKDKELLEKKPFLKGVRESFYTLFPELKNSKWKLDANRLTETEFEFEIFLDKLKFYSKRSTSGYGPQFIFFLQPLCSKCGKELLAFDRPLITDIKSLLSEIEKKYKCVSC